MGIVKYIENSVIHFNIAILISGHGKNMEAIAKTSQKKYCNIAIVISNKECEGIHRADKMGIKTLIIDRNKFTSKKLFENNLQLNLIKYSIDIICLAGFMEILSKYFLKYWKDKILNIHPSLLPLFPGLNTHKRVLESGMSIHGATVHIVTEGIDEGPILSQGVISVFNNDNEATLQKKVSQIEHSIYPETISKFLKQYRKN